MAVREIYFQSGGRYLLSRQLWVVWDLERRNSERGKFFSVDFAAVRGRVPREKGTR